MLRKAPVKVSSSHFTSAQSGDHYLTPADIKTIYDIAPTTPVRQALAALFESFVLPLHKATFQHLVEGDYLLHAFDGNLHLAFGVYGGVEPVVYAGQSAVDLSKTLGSPLAKFDVGAKPEIKANADLNFTLEYNSQFEALLSRSGDAGGSICSVPQSATPRRSSMAE